MSVLDSWIREVDEALPNAKVLSPALGVNDRPRVSLVGAVNTCKTSLLRRLLAEDGQAHMPFWARVSGREETSDVHSVHVFGCELIDTPGLEGLSRWHADTTVAAVASADAFVVTMGLNFGSRSDDEEAGQTSTAEFLAGVPYRPAGFPYPDRGVVVFVGPLDLGGPDPDLAPTEVAQFAERKRAETVQYLHSITGSRPAWTVVVGSADHGGRMASATDIDAKEFDNSRPWDHIEQLVDWLRACPGSLSILRAGAAVRSRLFALSTDIRETQASTEALRTEALNAEADLAAARALGAATADLEVSIEKGLLRVAEETADVISWSGEVNREDVRQVLRHRIGEWAANAADRIAEAGARLDESVDLRVDDERAEASSVRAAERASGRAADERWREGVQVIAQATSDWAAVVKDAAKQAAEEKSVGTNAQGFFDSWAEPLGAVSAAVLTLLNAQEKSGIDPTRRQRALQELRRSANTMGDEVLRDAEGRSWRDVVRKLSESAGEVLTEQERRLSELERAASASERRYLQLTRLRDTAPTGSSIPVGSA